MNPRDCEQNLCSPKFMKIALQEKGVTSLTHCNLVHQIIPIAQAMKIPDAKAAVDKEWKKLETMAARDLEKVKSKKEVILEAQRDKKKVHFASLIDICHLKYVELEPKLQKYKAESYMVKDDSGASAVFTEQIMKTILQEEETTHCSFISWFTSLFLCLKQ